MSACRCRLAPRHNALTDSDVKEMLGACGADSVDALMKSALPESLPTLKSGLDLGRYTEGMSESEFLEHFKCAPPVAPARPAHELQYT